MKGVFWGLENAESREAKLLTSHSSGGLAGEMSSARAQSWCQEVVVLEDEAASTKSTTSRSRKSGGMTLAAKSLYNFTRIFYRHPWIHQERTPYQTVVGITW